MKMKKPEMQVSRFAGEDVIATSSTIRFEGVFDDTAGNIQLFYNGAEKNSSEIVNALTQTYGEFSWLRFVSENLTDYIDVDIFKKWFVPGGTGDKPTSGYGYDSGERLNGKLFSYDYRNDNSLYFKLKSTN